MLHFVAIFKCINTTPGTWGDGSDGSGSGSTFAAVVAATDAAAGSCDLALVLVLTAVVFAAMSFDSVTLVNGDSVANDVCFFANFFFKGKSVSKGIFSSKSSLGLNLVI